MLSGLPKHGRRCACPTIAKLPSACTLRPPPLQRFNDSTFSMRAANDHRRGMAIKYNDNSAIVMEAHHRTPGNMRTFVQAVIRYINTVKSADIRFDSTDKL